MTADLPGGDAEALLARAVDAENEGYLRAEAALRRTPQAAPALQAGLAHDDPIARLLAQVLLDAAESESDDLDTADRYLEVSARWFARTVAGSPPIRGVVDNLTARYGDRLAGYLAVRLAKVPAAPAWRAQVALAYLERHPTPTVTDALLRFASQTSEPALQEAAARVAAGAGDVALAAKVAAERDRLARAGRSLPGALAALVG